MVRLSLGRKHGFAACDPSFWHIYGLSQTYTVYVLTVHFVMRAWWCHHKIPIGTPLPLISPPKEKKRQDHVQRRAVSAHFREPAHDLCLEVLILLQLLLQLLQQLGRQLLRHWCCPIGGGGQGGHGLHQVLLLFGKPAQDLERGALRLFGWCCSKGRASVGPKMAHPASVWKCSFCCWMVSVCCCIAIKVSCFTRKLHSQLLEASYTGLSRTWVYISPKCKTTIWIWRNTY